MESNSFYWAILAALSGVFGYYYGKYLESLKQKAKKSEDLANEVLENKKDVSLFKEEPRDSGFLKKELERERETKRKLTEQYESELSYLKAILTKNQQESNERNTKDRQERTQKLFEEMSYELGPTVQIVEGSAPMSNDDVEKAIDNELIYVS